MSDIFSKENTQAALDKLPAEQGGIGVVAHGKDVGVAIQGSKDLGKGWTLKGTASWMKDTGYSAAAWLGWKGK